MQSVRGSLNSRLYDNVGYMEKKQLMVFDKYADIIIAICTSFLDLIFYMLDEITQSKLDRYGINEDRDELVYKINYLINEQNNIGNQYNIIDNNFDNSPQGLLQSQYYSMNFLDERYIFINNLVTTVLDLLLEENIDLFQLLLLYQTDGGRSQPRLPSRESTIFYTKPFNINSRSLPKLFSKLTEYHTKFLGTYDGLKFMLGDNEDSLPRDQMEESAYLWDRRNISTSDLISEIDKDLTKRRNSYTLAI